MDYVLLTPEMRRDQLESRARAAEARHFEISLNLDLAKTRGDVGSDDAQRQSLAAVEAEVTYLRGELSRLEPKVAEPA